MKKRRTFLRVFVYLNSNRHTSIYFVCKIVAIKSWGSLRSAQNHDQFAYRTSTSKRPPAKCHRPINSAPPSVHYEYSCHYSRQLQFFCSQWTPPTFTSFSDHCRAKVKYVLLFFLGQAIHALLTETQENISFLLLSFKIFQRRCKNFE